MTKLFLIALLTTPLQAAVCTYTLTSPTRFIVLGPNGGSGTIQATASDSSCSWSATSTVPWLHLSPAGGNGSLSFTYMADPNAGVARSYFFTISGNNDGSLSFLFQQDSPPPQNTGPFGFVPVAPCRLVDTRDPNRSGAFGPPSMLSGSLRTIPLTAGACNIPATAKAYSLNFTVVPPGPFGFLSVWPTGTARPTVSTVNSSTGATVANAALDAAGTNGAISVYTSDPTDLVIDINGYFITASDPTALSYYPLTPCRAADTRLTTLGPISGGSARVFTIGGSCGVPATAQAFALNITVVPNGPLGFLTTWPDGQPQPTVSTLNDQKGIIMANAAIVPAGNNGAIDVYAYMPPGSSTDVVIDVSGYFAPTGAPSALSYYSLAPIRLVDTRQINPLGSTLGPPSLAAQTARSFAFAGVAGIPFETKALSLNITVVPSAQLSYLTVWPSVAQQPLASTLNSLDGSIVANAAIVPTSAPTGSISFFPYLASGTTDLVVDINGYFLPTQ